MRAKEFPWTGAADTADQIRIWAESTVARPPESEIRKIADEVREGDAALLRLTERFDATEKPPQSLCIERDEFAEAPATIDPQLRESLEIAAANIQAVAEAQMGAGRQRVALPQGQAVTVGEAAVASAGIYAPGGKATYPSSVLMGAIPARVAGVNRVALATPPRPDGQVDPIVLAAAAIGGVDQVHPVGGAQAIFALAYGTESVGRVDVIAGPGNDWVTEAKRAVYGTVGIDSLAGPSELMVVVDRSADPEWVALDLCAQAEHGGGGVLLIGAAEEEVLAAVSAAAERVAAERLGVIDAPLAVVRLPDNGLAALDLANAFAPEHLQLIAAEAVDRASLARTPGCVFLGPYGATAFGDYAAGSNHILPTGGAGRFSGPLAPRVFRRPTATVEISVDAAARLAPHVDALARAEGLPVHGESAMIRRS
jgi:histidinol dehydrogenase